MSPGYCILWGLPNQPISNVTLNNVQISGSIGFEFYNAQNVQFTGATALSGSLITYNAQLITAQPQNQTAAAGGTVAFNVSSPGTAGTRGPIAPAYRWTFNGQPLADGPQAGGAVITGSSTPTLLLRNSSASSAGSYAATVIESLDSYGGGLQANASTVAATSGAATLAVAATADAGRLINLSTRASIIPGGTGLIAGFVIEGTNNNGSPQPVLVRGIGPGLTPFGVQGALADPNLQLFSLPAGHCRGGQ